MNQSLLLHIVERLEGFLQRLPASIQKPVLHELTPLKELFLQQRPPRFVLTGSNKLPVQEVVATLFAAAQSDDLRNVLMEVFRWQAINVGGHGTITLLDARGADEIALPKIRDDLNREPSDIFFHLAADGARPFPQREIENLSTLMEWNDLGRPGAKVIGISIADPKRTSSRATAPSGEIDISAKLQTALDSKPALKQRLLHITRLPVSSSPSPEFANPELKNFLRLLANELPNEARVEMIRISRDREAQAQIAQVLVKSTTAICTAIGAQPIPLADLPVLTALQLAMVSGIMYIGGRERSLRAATEFIGALGVNVGAGMVLREGTRALLKFFPGWGNVVCGMVAGAGTYAIGKAAVVYFLEGVSLKDARRTYLKSRKNRERPRVSQVTSRDPQITCE